MVPIPPKHRSFITCNAGLQSGTIPSPEGFSLVTSHIYTKMSVFFENTDCEPGFMNPETIRASLQKTLEYYYPLSGRLIKKENGRYDIGHFDKGVLFEVCDSADDFQVWKNSNFSYSVVPFEELIPIKRYVGRDSPLLGIRLVYTRCGSCIISLSIHHKLADGVVSANFISVLTRISRGEKIDPSEVHMYTDQKRKPVQPLPGVDHNTLYPHYLPGEAPLPTIKPGPSKKLIFSFDMNVMEQLYKKVIESGNDSNTRISQFEVIAAFVHRSIVKARKYAPDHCADLICIKAQHHLHPDPNMVNYFGNYCVPVPVPLTAKQTLDMGVFNVAKELRKCIRAIDIPYMESLEHYFNHSKNVEHIVGPVNRLAYGGVGFSDWSRFISNYDFGWGKHLCVRSFVETSPLPAITIMPYRPNTVEIVIQLDTESMNRLIRDRDFMAYVKTIH